MAIDWGALPKQVRDKIELREQTDNTFYRFQDEDYTEILFDELMQRSDLKNSQSFIASCYGVQGTGKSMSAISLCCFLDPNFGPENIYFDYNKLVYDRAKLRPGMAILVDEQSQSFGLDAHRVMIILSGIKEQLRKKSIHMIFCSPVLYEESKSSMYIIETMFIDKEELECVCALKTRDGHTLGHVRIPHPLKKDETGQSLASQATIDAYEGKKDDHLDKLLGNKNVDIFEERAQAVVSHPKFKMAEKIYVSRLGYMPQNMLIQIINAIYPEYNAGVVPFEIAGRVKLNKELSGEWVVAGAGTKKKDRDKARRGK